MGYAATYVALASALQPSKSTYKQAFSILQRLLPAGAVMSGRLLTSHRSSHLHSWRSDTFLLTFTSLVTLPETSSQPRKGGYAAGLTPGVAAGPLTLPAVPLVTQTDGLVVNISDVSQVLPCMDPTLPEGHSFWVCLHSRPQGLYFVVDHPEDAEVWVDAITLVAHLSQQA